MIKAIGGYFELELKKGQHYHNNAIFLNTARNCLEYILSARKYKKIYIPYYTCEAVLQPLQKLKVDYEFYHIDENLEPISIRALKNEEALMYTNYFGLKSSCLERLASLYKSQLIIDNAQAFYSNRICGIDTFYSPRKFFGVADGGYLYTDCLLKQEFPIDKSCNRMQHLLVRIEDGPESGFTSFKKTENDLGDKPISLMSVLTSRILENVDYMAAKKRRRENFLFLQKYLWKNNLFNIPLREEDEVPMVYPYYSTNTDLRRKLIEQKVFVAQYWPNVLEWCKPTDFEYELCQHILPLPIDQRYGMKDMERIVKLIKE